MLLIDRGLLNIQWVIVSVSLVTTLNNLSNKFTISTAFYFFFKTRFALDMVLSFHTSYLDQFSTNVDNREKIHGHYGKTPRRFLADAIANVPIDLLSHVIIVPGSTVQVRFSKDCYRFAYKVIHRQTPRPQLNIINVQIVILTIAESITRAYRIQVITVY